MTLRAILVLGALLFATPALASDPKPQRGGQVVHAGEYHLELVAKDGAVEVFLADHDNKPMPATRHKGLAILAVDGKSQRIILQPVAGGDRLAGTASGALPKQPKGVVQITPPNGKTVQARFN